MNKTHASHRSPLVSSGLLLTITTSLLVACGGGGSGSNSGSGAGDAAADQSLNAVASDCITMANEGQTFNNGVAVEGNNNIRVTNHCDYAVNVKLYSAGYVGTTTNRLLPGASAIDDFFVTPGQPRAFACRDPFVPAIPPSAASTTCI